MGDTDKVSGQSITRAVILYFSGFWRQSIDASYRPHIDIAELIFRNAANVVAGQAISDGVMLEDRMFGGRVIDAAQTVSTRGNPQAPRAIGEKVCDRTVLNTVLGTQ